jgi:hypothetical protein
MADDLAVPALEEEHHLAEMLLVRRAVDGQHARAEAALDVVLDARAAPVAEHVVAAGAEREDLPDGVERVAHREALANGPSSGFHPSRSGA